MCFLGRNLDKAWGLATTCSSFHASIWLVERLKRMTRSQSYTCFPESPFEARSWASRNVMARSSTLGPASMNQNVGRLIRFIVGYFLVLL
ncbi:hypothetical protein Hanom_Chr12g01143621 [Helianthus anomalus]